MEMYEIILLLFSSVIAIIMCPIEGLIQCWLIQKIFHRDLNKKTVILASIVSFYVIDMIPSLQIFHRFFNLADYGLEPSEKELPTYYIIEISFQFMLRYIVLLPFFNKASAVEYRNKKSTAKFTLIGAIIPQIITALCLWYEYNKR